jgi:riboflavin kinase / FMN adenylyltransferase
MGGARGAARVTGAVSVGVFDGLHVGHQQILRRALERARARQAQCVVVSFDPHPDLVLRPSFEPLPPLTPHIERRRRLEAMGVDRYEVLPFTRELAALDPETFVDRHLIEPYGMRDLVVGARFALGRGRSGDVPRLREIGRARGFEVEEVPLLEVGGQPVSSTRVRTALGEGRVAEAAALLGRRYDLTGRVVEGERIGRALGVPTANLRLHEEKLVPAHGVYAVWARLPGEDAWRAAAMSVGVRPTFGGHVRTLEVHILDWTGDLVGRDLQVEFAHWLRPELKFETPEELVAAMRDDLARTRELLATGPELPAER